MRFAFPAVSLEGKAYWILQTAPISRRVVLWSKFWLNLLPLLLLGELLVFLSNLLLQVPNWMMLLSLVTIVVMTFGITAICVGTGALYPKFNFDNAAEIPTSFGGALCMIFSLSFVGIVVMIATTNFQSWLNHSSVIGFQREILSKFNEARTRSMASSLQHRLLIDMNAETVTLQRGTLGTGTPPTGWTNVGQPVVGSRGAGIDNVICTPTAPVPTTFALVLNPDGQTLIQDNTAGSVSSPLTQADIHISATNAGDQATIRVFGWTSKARLANGWL